MKDKKISKGFTLIELIAVLVILAVIALIVTPLVLNIIKSAKKSANERSIDEYGKAVELAAASYLLDTGKKANSFDVLNVEYSGNEVKCNVSEVYKNNVFLSQCSVNGKEVKNAKTSDGYYHYGDATKFVNIYGDAIKKAIVRYQKDNNDMPTNLNELTINADGLNVNCDSSKINSDGTVYLSNCSLSNIELIDNDTNDGYYHYGENKYLIGDKVNYNGIEFYVIENVGDESDTVHLLKVNPISQSEIKDYMSSTDLSDKIFDNYYTYLHMQYLYRDTCTSSGYYNGTNTGCTTDYLQSDVKKVIDIWGEAYLSDNDLVADEEGYKLRLLTEKDFFERMNIESFDKVSDEIQNREELKFLKLSYGSGLMTMIPGENKDYDILILAGSNSYNFYTSRVYNVGCVFPVINLKKAAIL